MGRQFCTDVCWWRLFCSQKSLLKHAQLGESLDGWVVMMDGCFCAFFILKFCSHLNYYYWMDPIHHSSFCLFLARSSAYKIEITHFWQKKNKYRPEYPQLSSCPSSALHSPGSIILIEKGQFLILKFLHDHILQVFFSKWEKVSTYPHAIKFAICICFKRVGGIKCCIFA